MLSEAEYIALKSIDIKDLLTLEKDINNAIEKCIDKFRDTYISDLMKAYNDNHDNKDSYIIDYINKYICENLDAMIDTLRDMFDKHFAKNSESNYSEYNEMLEIARSNFINSSISNFKKSFLEETSIESFEKNLRGPLKEIILISILKESFSNQL